MFSFKDISDNVKAVAPSIKEFVTSYMERGDMDNATWLAKQLATHFPKLNPEQLVGMGQGLFDGVNSFNARLAAAEAAAAQGRSNAEWLRDYLEDNLPEGNMQAYGDYLEQANGSLAEGNQVLEQAVQNPSGMINVSEEQMASPVVPCGTEWNRFSVQPMVADFTQQAEFAGMNGMSIGQTLVPQLAGMPTGVFPEEMMEQPSETLDQGIKLATAAALKVFIDKKKIPFLSKMFPIGAVSNFACFGVEGAKCLGRFAMGKISAAQALEQMKRTSVVAMTDFLMMGVTPKLLSMIPVIGVPLSFATSIALANMSTEAIQEKLAQGIDLVAGMAQDVVQGVKETITGTVQSVKNSVVEFLGLSEA